MLSMVKERPRAAPPPSAEGETMLRRLAHLAQTALRSETAQATTEYALVVFVTVALLVGISSIVLDGLATHYEAVTSVVCWPIP